MNEHGRRLLRWWKQRSPAAYDQLVDPAAHFAALGAEVEKEIEEQVRRHLAGDDALPPRADLVLMPGPEVALTELPAHLVRDPRGDFVDADGMPRYSHRLWRLLDDPTVPAAVFQTEWSQWLQSVPTYERSVVEAPDEGSWSAVSDGAPRERPVLLLDIDGCLSPLRPAGSVAPGSVAEVSVDPAIAAGLVALADRYDLAWATTWEDLAHLLGTELGRFTDCRSCRCCRRGRATPMAGTHARSAPSWSSLGNGHSHGSMTSSAARTQIA